MQQLKQKFTAYGIEHRPIVGGNLLRQPFLKNYQFTVIKHNYNVDLINQNGFYIGNSQFVNNRHLDQLENLLNTL